MRRSTAVVPVLAALLLLCGCGDDDDSDAGADSGSDADTDTDTDTDTDVDTDTDTATETGTETDTDTDTITDTDTGELSTVLFVGNSYTASNDLAGLVAELAFTAEVDPPVVTDEFTVGGATLQDHLLTTGAMVLIDAGGWTMVVLQGQSVEPLWQPTVFQEAAADLAQAVFDAGGTPVFFETWAREEGHAVYDEPWSGGTPAAMQAGLREAYQQAAGDSGGTYAPVGDAWEATLAAHPDIDLFATDGSHPSLAGSYLAACVFFCVITGEPLDEVAYWPDPLGESEALDLQQMAEQAVFE